MINCSENVLGPGGAGVHGVSNDPPDSGEASLEAKTGHMASGVEGGDEVGDGGAGDGGVEDGGGGKDGGKAGRKKQVYKGGNRGKKKEKWSDGERRVLWECYVRSGRKRSQGYIRKVKEMWDGRDLSVRSGPSLISQLNAIEFQDLLSASERREIERVVSEGREGQVEDGQAVGEEDEGGVRADEMDDGGGEGGVGGDGRIGLEGGGALEVSGTDREMVDGVDFVVMGEVMVQEGDDGVRGDEAEGAGNDGRGDGEGVVGMELGDAGRGMVNGVEGEEIGEVMVQEAVGDVRGEDEGPRVMIERVDLWKSGGEVRALAGVEKDVLKKMREVFASEEVVELPNLKALDRRKVMVEVKMVDGLLHNLVREGMSVTEVNRLLYVGAYMVAERLGKLGNGKKKKEKGKPWWQRRLEASIGEWRKDLSRVEGIRKGEEVGRKIRDRLDRKYGMVERGALAVSTLLKNKIQSASTKIKWHVGKCVARRQNNLFKNNQSQLYKELGGGECGTPNSKEVLKGAEARKFWSGIWNVDKQHDRKASWIVEVSSKLAETKQQDEVVLQLVDVKEGIRKMANWKAPGPDGVRGFWFKKFQCLHQSIVASLQECLENGDVPPWMVKGRTVLIQKDAAKGVVASNYRPITCLPLMWKLLTGILADKMYDHLQANQLFPDEQKGCRRRSRGTKDQLLIDKAVLRDARVKKRSLSMAWIDYRKAYDMVPHSWIVEMLRMVKVAGNVEGLVTRSMKDWKTVLTADGKVLGEVDIRRGIFQGDSLSPLLFIVIMLPLSMLLRKEKKLGYLFGSGGKSINHLVFMDDIKLYGKSEKELDALVELVRVFSRDIGMEFGVDKCAVVGMKKGVRVHCEGISLPNGEVMKELDENGYKYLGVLEGTDIMHREMKKKVKEEYLRRVKLVARSRLYAGNLIKGINAWAVSVVRYSAGVLEWTKNELKGMDVRTRKLLTMFGVFHMRSSVPRLYMKRKEGGRGLMSVMECVRGEEIALKEYVVASGEWMLKVVGENVQVGESKVEFKKKVAKKRVDDLGKTKMHGKWWEGVKDVADGRSWQWLRGGYLAKSTEAYLFAAQEQALRTRFKRNRIEHEDVDPLCRVCRKQVESVAHLASACGGLAQKEYKRRHDRMGLRVYWELCRRYEVKCAGKWFEEVPEEVRVNEAGDVEIWWDRGIHTTKPMEHNRPDVVVVDRRNKHWILVDFAVPWDKNVVRKEEEKITKYSPLALEVRRLHGVSTRIIPIVVGSLGVVSKNLPGYLRDLQVPDVLGGLQTSAVVGTTIILRKVLSI